METTANNQNARNEGEAVVFPWLRQIRDKAGVGRGAREYFDAGEKVAIPAAHQDLPLIR